MIKCQVRICPPTWMFKRPIIHPSECRSFAYPEVTHTQAIDARLHSEDGIGNQTITHQWENGLYPSVVTVNRWMRRFQRHGHACAFCWTGSKQSQRKNIKGRKLILLALQQQAALPKATFVEVNAFLYSMNLADPDNRFYSYSQLHRAEDSVLITKKQSWSTTAYQAMKPVNRFQLWTIEIRNRIVVMMIYYSILNQSLSYQWDYVTT